MAPGVGRGVYCAVTVVVRPRDKHIQIYVDSASFCAYLLLFFLASYYASCLAFPVLLDFFHSCLSSSFFISFFLSFVSAFLPLFLVFIFFLVLHFPSFVFLSLYLSLCFTFRFNVRSQVDGYTVQLFVWSFASPV